MGLGERLNGIQEVSGSIPLISTKRQRNCLINPCFLRKTGIFLCLQPIHAVTYPQICSRMNHTPKIASSRSVQIQSTEKLREMEIERNI